MLRQCRCTPPTAPCDTIIGRSAIAQACMKPSRLMCAKSTNTPSCSQCIHQLAAERCQAARVVAPEAERWAGCWLELKCTRPRYRTPREAKVTQPRQAPLQRMCTFNSEQQSHLVGSVRSDQCHLRRGATAALGLSKPPAGCSSEICSSTHVGRRDVKSGERDQSHELKRPALHQSFWECRTCPPHAARGSGGRCRADMS